METQYVWWSLAKLASFRVFCAMLFDSRTEMQRYLNQNVCVRVSHMCAQWDEECEWERDAERERRHTMATPAEDDEL